MLLEVGLDFLAGELPPLVLLAARAIGPVAPVRGRPRYGLAVGGRLAFESSRSYLRADGKQSLGLLPLPIPAPLRD